MPRYRSASPVRRRQSPPVYKKRNDRNNRNNRNDMSDMSDMSDEMVGGKKKGSGKKGSQKRELPPALVENQKTNKIQRNKYL